MDGPARGKVSFNGRIGGLGERNEMIFFMLSNKFSDKFAGLS